MIRRIAITGPESSGKSTLAKSLAQHFNTVYVPEFARQYLNDLNRPYNYNDIEFIAKQQMKLEEKLIKNAERFLFCDSDMLVTKIWCDVKFGKCHPWIENAVEENRYDLYLLCKTDIPWQKDPLREDENNRDKLFELYKKELESREFPFKIISGNDRFNPAIQYLSEL